MDRADGMMADEKKPQESRDVTCDLSPIDMMGKSLDELINEMCPDGVEYKPLAEVCQYATERINTQDMGQAGYVGVENLLQNKKGRGPVSFDTSEQKVIEFKSGDVLIGNIRPYLKKIWLADKAGGTNGDVLVIRIREEYEDSVSQRYLFQCLSSDSFFHYMMSHAKGAKMPRGDKKATIKFLVPVPPLPVQERIAELLDKMAELEAELEAEFEARRQQYEWWRDHLLDFRGTRGGGSGRMGLAR